MGEGARVDSIDVLKEFKIALWKFQEAATVALGDAESEMHRILLWLQTEQDSHWQHQIRKREEIVGRCREAVRMKKVFKDATGRQQSAIEEEKALKVAMRNLEEAQQKLAMVRKWSRQLPKEIEMYKGGVQRFATTVQSDIPVAASHLDKLAQKLEAYVNLQSAAAGELIGAGEGAASGAGGASMARGVAGVTSVSEDELGRLFAQVPTPDLRAAAPLTGVFDLAVPTIPKEQQAPGMLPITPRALPAETTRIFVAKGVREAAKIFLNRHPEPASVQDGEWSIQPAHPSGELQWEAVGLADVLKARPDLRDLLGLPRGFSVIIDSAGVGEVLDARRQPAWRSA
jgi:hypothetical protein